MKEEWHTTFMCIKDEIIGRSCQRQGWWCSYKATFKWSSIGKDFFDCWQGGLNRFNYWQYFWWIHAPHYVLGCGLGSHIVFYLEAATFEVGCIFFYCWSIVVFTIPDHTSMTSNLVPRAIFIKKPWHRIISREIFTWFVSSIMKKKLIDAMPSIFHNSWFE